MCSLLLLKIIKMAFKACKPSGPVQVTIKWLLLGSATVRGRVNHQDNFHVTKTKVNLASHPSGVSKSSTGLSGWG